MTTARASAPARAALAGNPSDGYGGAVLALTLESHRARASVGEGSVVAANLVNATVARFAREFGCGADTPVATDTDIPLSVGLGGSSAIVIATLRALAAEHGVSIDPDTLALLALSVEVDDLGISAGLQDRLVQSHGGLVFMDFARPGHPRVEILDAARTGPLLVAWRAGTSEASGIVHGDLRARYRSGEPTVRAAMRDLAGWAQRAALAVRGAQPTALGEAIDATFDIRAELIPLNPRHVEMITLARGAGAAANYTGSGGAVVCLCQSEDHRDAVALTLAEHGCHTVACN